MTDSLSPLVSVIVCTYNRPTLLERALESVLRQDFEDFEIILIDDGSEPPLDLAPSVRDRVRVVRTEHRGIGSARAEGLKLARGVFAAYCDDDDEWKPNHLSALVAFLRHNPSVALVYADSEWEQEGSPPSVAYSLDYDLAELISSNYIFATDVMHRVAAAHNVGGFDPTLQAYEDWDLWLRMSQKFVLRHLKDTLATHHWHERCVAGREEAWYEWERITGKHACRLSIEGVAPHHRPARQRNSAAFNADTWRPGRRELIWHSIMAANHSYGYVSTQLLSALEQHGIDVAMMPLGNQPISGFERFYKPVDPAGRMGFYYHFSPEAMLLGFDRLIVYSMWESSSVPREHVEEINRAATLLYVPCREHKESFEASGVRVPIKVLHHGVDPKSFPYLERPHRNIFTFGTYGNLSPRKGADVLIRAFKDEFSCGDSVRLILKTSGPIPYDLADPRIQILAGFMDHEALLQVLGEMDAFVMPSRGEGFGLCGIEALSTGLPLIATDWSGPSEYLNASDSFPLSYRLEDANGIEIDGRKFYGIWAEPDYEHLRCLMRWLYEHRTEAAEKGRIAAERVHREWTWDRIAKQICNDLDAIAADK